MFDARKPSPAVAALRPSEYTAALVHALRAEPSRVTGVRALEIGCGSGVVLAVLGSLGAGALCGIDIEDEAIATGRALLQDLSARGHRFQKIGRKGEVRYGYASGVSVDPAARLLEGGADPRRSHAAVAVTEIVETTQQ